MDNNDYEKAKQECWDETIEILPAMPWGSLGNVREAFDFIFDTAYQLGKAHAVGTDSPHERKMIAAMAMQGILASPSIMAATTVSLQTEAAKQGLVLQTKEVSELTINAMATMAVQSADALLTELNNQTNETDKED